MCGFRCSPFLMLNSIIGSLCCARCLFVGQLPLSSFRRKIRAVCVSLSLSLSLTSLGVRGRSCACDSVTFLSLSLLRFRIDDLCPCSRFLFPFFSVLLRRSKTQLHGERPKQRRRGQGTRCRENAESHVSRGPYTSRSPSHPTGILTALSAYSVLSLDTCTMGDVVSAFTMQALSSEAPQSTE